MQAGYREVDVAKLDRATLLEYSYSHAKQSTYRAFNAVFGKVGRVASSEVG